MKKTEPDNPTANEAGRQTGAGGREGADPTPAPRPSSLAAKMERWARDAMGGWRRYLERPADMKIDPAAVERGAIRPTFETDRLRVFHVPLRLFPAGFTPRTFDEAIDAVPRHVFLAFRKNSRQTPRVAATAVIFRYRRSRDEGGGATPWVDWVEVSTECRRQGIGTEFLDGIERYSGWTLDLVDTEPAFEEAIEEARRRRAAAVDRDSEAGKDEDGGAGKEGVRP